jgi:hypothetical protein
MPKYGNDNAVVEGKDSFGSQVSMVKAYSNSTSNNASWGWNDYEPEEDYKYKPVSETDPWFTEGYINVFHTEGGEFFIKRNDDLQPTDVSQTYVGPYFRWVREPDYSQKRKQQFGRLNDVVIGQSFYGRTQRGRPKNKGLRPNKILEPLKEILRADLRGPTFLDTSEPDPSIAPIPKNRYEREQAEEQGIFLAQVADLSETLPEAVVLKDTGDKKYIHITDLVSMNLAKTVLSDPNSNMRQLAPTSKRFGMKGRAPVITNQPNAKIDFED